MIILTLGIIFSILHITLINRNKQKIIKIVSLIYSFIFIINYCLIIIFYNNNSQFQYLFNMNWINVPYYFKWNSFLFGVDFISLLFIGLSLLLIPVCILISWNNIKFLLKEFILLNQLILFFLVTFFMVLDLVSFYILFEIILIPMFLIIGVWGSREEKIEASFYFFFYTFIGSFLMLSSILKLYSILGSTNLIFIYNYNINNSIELWLFIGFFISLSIKIPMLPFHLWLPKAHVEAPIAGSVLLAGILLKLGGYGFLRILIPITSNSLNYMSSLLIMLSLMAITYAGLSTLRQTDLKKLIAYSSISHMGIVTLCIFIKSTEGLISSIIMMLAHGFISSAFFIMSYLLYFRFHTRTIKYYKGLTVCMPILSLLSFLIILGNIGFPLTLNFIAEFIALKSIFNYSLFSSVIFCVGSLITLIYSLYLFNRVFFGSFSLFITHCRDIINLELNTLLILIIICILLGIFPNLIIENLSLQLYNIYIL